MLFLWDGFFFVLLRHLFLKIINKENNMGGFFVTVSKSSCVTDLFYGTDYNSHLGTKRGGLATYSQEKGFIRSIQIWKVHISDPSLKESLINLKAMPA